MPTGSRRAVLRTVGGSVALNSIHSFSGTTVNSANEGKPRNVADRLGSTHVAPEYSFTLENVLNEGAE